MIDCSDVFVDPSSGLFVGSARLLYSFEETTDILLAAAEAGLRDPLAGVSENILLGQLAPIGTGSFDLLLDEEELTDIVEPTTDALGTLSAPTIRSPGSTAANGVVDRPGSTWTPRPASGRRHDLTATPAQAYSPAHWMGTPVRPGSVRGGSPFAMRMSPSEDGADFSPMHTTPGNATGARRASFYGGTGAHTPMQSPGRDWTAPASPGMGGASPYGGSAGYGVVSPSGDKRATSPFTAPTSSGYRATSPGPGIGSSAPGFGATAGGSGYRFVPLVYSAWCLFVCHT